MTRPERLKKAKLVPPYKKLTHTQKIQQKILNLQHIQLQNITPFKQISARLATSVGGVKNATAQNATAQNATVAPTQSDPLKTTARLPFIKESSGSRLAFNLLLVRPWVLVVGFWLISMLSASLAWEGMISPKKLTMALPQPNTGITSAANKNSFLRVEQDTDNSVVQNSAPIRAQRTSATSTTTADNANFPKWSIGALVGTCAAGCLGISRRRAMVRIASMRSRGRYKAHNNHLAHNHSGNRRTLKKVAIRKNGKATFRPTGKPQKGRPVTGQPIRNKFAASQSSSTFTAFKSAQSKKRRPRKRAAAMQQKTTVAGNRVLISRSTAQQNASTPHSTSPRPVKHPVAQGASRRQGVVSVVPASTSHALDWTNGSLAHQLDVRSQHTASM